MKTLRNLLTILFAALALFAGGCSRRDDAVSIRNGDVIVVRQGADVLALSFRSQVSQRNGGDICSYLYRSRSDGVASFPACDSASGDLIPVENHVGPIYSGGIKLFWSYHTPGRVWLYDLPAYTNTTHTGFLILKVKASDLSKSIDVTNAVVLYPHK